MPRRRRRQPVLGILLGLIVLVLVAGAGVLLTVSFNGLKPMIARAALRATGRELVIGGDVNILPTLPPTMEVGQVALANPPGGSRPEMLRIEDLRVQFRLLPLLKGRVELADIEMVQPDLLLETDKQGNPNWHFTPAPTAPAPASSAASVGTASTPPALTLREVRVQEATLTWHDARSGRTVVVQVPQLQARAASESGPVTLNASLVLEGQRLTLSGRTGPVAGLQNASAAVPWPVQLTLDARDARLSVGGSIAQPQAGRGYALQVTARAPDLAALSALVGTNMPPLHDVETSVTLTDAGGASPAMSNLKVRVGASDLQRVVPGLVLNRAALSAPGTDEPVEVDVQGTLRGTPLQLAGQLGSPAALLAGAGAMRPLPVDLRAEAAGASMAAKGTIAAPLTRSGIDLAVSARVPALEALSPLAGQALPTLHDIAFDGKLADSAGGYADAVALHGFSLKLPQGDLGGDLDVGLGARPTVTGSLAADRIDLDALLAVLAKPEPGATAPAPPPAARQAPSRLIPDTPLPLAGLGSANADLRFKLGALRAHGVDWRDLAGRVHLQDGRLALDPFTGQLPGGGFDAKLGLQATGSAPASLVLRAPAVALQPLLLALHLPADVSGTVNLDADLQSTGTSPHELAAGLNGLLSVTATDGELDNQLLMAAFGDVLHAARLPADLGAGRTKLRCLAIRLDATRGVANLTALLVDTLRLQVAGGGTFNLGEETLALRLRALLHVGPGIVVPVRVGGSFVHPKIAVDSAGAAAAGAAAALAGKGGALGALAKSLPGAPETESCGAAMAAATGAPAPSPAAPAPAVPSGAPKPPKPADILRQLLR